jgi:F-type H+-transporting ATPase subunit alpha
MKKIAGGLRLDLAQYRELEAFAQLGTDLDKATQAQLDPGVRLVEILKQPQYQPMPVEEQIAIIYAGTRGHLDDIPVAKVRAFERDFLEHMRANKSDVLKKIAEVKDLPKDVDEALAAAITDFKRTWRS